MLNRLGAVQPIALLAAAVIAVGLATTGTTGTTSNDAGRHRALAVTGFQEEGDPLAAITRSAGALTTVGLDGVNISANGATVGTPDAGARKVLALAHAHHLRAEFLVGNFGSRDFSEPRAYRLVSNPANIDAVAASLVHSLTLQGWDGISVDLESLRSRDRAGLTSFLTALHDDLPAGKTLSVCVSNVTSAARYRSWGYDLPAIAKVVSRVILMAYDEHGSWENTPGPVGALSWQKAGLKVVLRSVPADQVDLGEAGYGYAWRKHANYQVSDEQARRLVARHHVAARWNARVGEWHARLPGGSTLWWADARSYAVRVRLARHDHLHGLAVWDLGLSDPIS
jgi:spore germination protein